MSRRISALALALFAAVPVAASAVHVHDQTAVSPSTLAFITPAVFATDFTLTERTRLESAELWFCDSAINDDGSLGSYSGTLSWRLYTDSAGSPGAPIVSGTESAPAVDAGFNCNTGGGDSDAGRVRISFDSRATLAAGTYWLAVREGAWAAASDGSSVSWVGATGSLGAGAHYSVDITNPGSWENGFVELSLQLSGVSPHWAQIPGDLSGSSAVGISDAMVAVDFTPGVPRSGGFELFLADSVNNDNGLLDSFSGTLSWAIYSDFLDAPGSLLASGSDTSPRLRDTLFQDVDGGDVFAVRSKFRGLPVLAPDTYWLVIHEGTWLEPNDNSSVWWLESPGVQGNPHLANPDESDPSPEIWVEGSNWDPAFALFDELLFASGFESGRACAWTGLAVCP